MQQGTIIQSCLRKFFFLWLICCAPGVHAQVNDSTQISFKDSVNMIKQLVKEQLEMIVQPYKVYGGSEYTRLTALLKDATIIDSLGTILLRQVQGFKNTTIQTGKESVNTSLLSVRQLLQQQLNKLMQSSGVKDLFRQFTGLVNQPVLQFKGGTVIVQGQSAPQLIADGDAYVNSIKINTSWSLLGIPVGMQLLRQDIIGAEYYNRNAFSFQFNREDYLESLRNKIKLKTKPGDWLPDYNAILEQSEDAVVLRLKRAIDSISHSYNGLLCKQVAALGDWRNILQTDPAVLKDRLLSSEFTASLEQKKNQLAGLQQAQNTGRAWDKALYDSLLLCIRAEQGAEAIVNRIHSFKDELQKSGLLEKLQQADLAKENDIRQALQRPEKMVSMAKEQLGLNGIQQLFLNISQLRLGINTISLSPLSIYQFTSNGINASFTTNKVYLFLIAAKQQETGSFLNSHFGGPALSAANPVLGIRAGKGDITANHIHLSFFTYKQNKGTSNNTVANAMPGSNTVATFSQQLMFGQRNWLNVEISKSNHRYNNERGGYDTLGTAKQLKGAGDFMNQMAFMLHWSGEREETALSYDLHAVHTGSSYVNPGNFLLSGGLTELGGSIKKQFLKKQLQVSAKGNYRQYQYTGYSTKWLNYNFNLQAQWKLRSGYVSLHYQPYQSLRLQDGRKYHTGATNRLSLEANGRKRFGRINYQYVFSIAALKNNYLFDSIPVNNSSILISLWQTVTLNGRSWYMDMQYNRAGNTSMLALLNTQLTAGAGCMYTIHRGITASTSLNYNSVQGWYRQLSIKQSINGQISDRFTIRLYADFARNIELFRPYTMGNSRFDWSIQYSFK